MRERALDFSSLSTSILARVDRGASSLEQAFLAAGQGLGRGLDTFNGISGGLAAFLDTLQGGSMATASGAIGTLAERLVAISQTLPRDAALLQELSTGNEGIGKHFEALLEHIRMMTIIASSARIEAAVFSETAGLDSFTMEISTLTASVRTAVSRCASDHTALTDRIGRLNSAQAGLDRDFRERLLVLSRELSDTFALIIERQGRSQTMAEGLQGHAATIAQTTGAALMALQSGDAARQRLEHIAAALRLGEAIADGRTVPADLAGDDTGGLLAALYALQAAQLSDLAEHFASEAGDIDDLLHRLSRDTVELVTQSRTVVGHTGHDGGSFLTSFRNRLTDAADLVGTCDRARAGVAEAMVALRADVTELSRTIADLGTTTRDLIVVGINAGLKAARLGNEGRSLMVIADELKRLAGLITEAASQLVGAYEALVLGSRNLDRDEAPPQADSNADMQAITTALQSSDMQINDFVTSLQAQAQQFDGDLNAVREQFRRTIAAISALEQDAEAITAAVSATPEDFDAAAAPLGQLLWPHYTMARERELHSALMGDSTEIPHAASIATEATFDDMLFAEAV